LAHLQLPQKLEPLRFPKRYKVIYGGRDGAKSWSIAQILLLLGTERPLRILCAREVQRSIKDSVHKLLCDQINRLELGYFYNPLQTEIRGLNGTEFLFTGLSDQTVESMKSFEGVDICWLEEARPLTKRSLTILIPTIRKAGSEIWMSFNPELDTDEVYVRFVENTPPDCLLIKINWNENPWYSRALDSERERMRLEDPEGYAHVWDGMCKAAVDGAIYFNELAAATKASRIRNVPYDPMLKVHTVWDLGYNDKVAIVFVQKVASEIRVIRYLEDNLKDLPWYVSELKKLEYNWGRDYLPHDGYAARLESGGKSTYHILKALGRPVVPKGLMPNVDVEEGIKQARLVFPRVYFDKEHARGLVDHLKRYKRSIPSTTGEPGAPVHDASSHGSDAFRYMALTVDKMTNDLDAPKLKYETVCA
jgi:phage terminase large subunit